MGRIILDAGVLPDEFERCWNNGGFNAFAAKATLAAFEKSKQEPVQEQQPLKPGTQSIQVGQMLDQNSLLQQINLDKKLK